MNWSPDIYAKTWEYVTLAHQNQTYGGRNSGVQINYINHLASVSIEIIKAIELSEKSLDENLAVQCALLHDTIEDTEISYNDILTNFDKKVADGVLALSKDTSIKSYQDMMSDSLQRILKQPIEIGMVKLADRICNLYHPPFYWNNERTILYYEESQVVLSTLKGVNPYLEERLYSKIQEYRLFIK